MKTTKTSCCYLNPKELNDFGQTLEFMGIQIIYSGFVLWLEYGNKIKLETATVILFSIVGKNLIHRFLKDNTEMGQIYKGHQMGHEVDERVIFSCLYFGFIGTVCDTEIFFFLTANCWLFLLICCRNVDVHQVKLLYKPLNRTKVSLCEERKYMASGCMVVLLPYGSSTNSNWHFNQAKSHNGLNKQIKQGF